MNYFSCSDGTCMDSIKSVPRYITPQFCFFIRSETCVLFCCLGTTDRNETELHSRRRHSDSRIAADCDGRPGHVWTWIQTCKYFLESSWSLLSYSSNSSPYHVGAGHNHYFGVETFFCQRCCDTLFWPIGPCIMLSPIQTRPRVGARPGLPEVILPHL
jgi:hypothetical protein